MSCSVLSAGHYSLFEKVTETKHGELAEVWPVACTANNSISISISLWRCIYSLLVVSSAIACSQEFKDL